MATIVQSFLGSNLSQVIGPGTTTLSVTGSWPQPTTAGNMLLAFGFFSETQATGLSLPTRSVSFFDSINTWTSLGATGFTLSTTIHGGACFILGNASPQSGTLTYQIIFGSTSASTYTCNLEFCAFEVSGCVASTNYAPHGPLVDNTKSASGTSSTPSVSGLVLADNDAVFTWISGNSANSSPPSGFASGFNMTTAITGQVAYNLNVPASTITETWGGSQTNWGMEMIGFVLSSAPPPFTGTSVNWGYIFG